MSTRILLLNGPNLNLLGQRDTAMYGAQTLEALERAVAEHAASLGAEVLSVQSNVEGELINALHDAQDTCIGVVFNPGGTATLPWRCGMPWRPSTSPPWRCT